MRPENGGVFVKFLNTRDTDVQLCNYVPKTANASDYEIKSFDKVKSQANRREALLSEINTQNNTEEEVHAIKTICSKYADVFFLKGDAMTSTNVYTEPIRLKPDAKPVYIKPYRIPEAQKQEVNRQIDQMLKDDIIEPARSEWSSPIIVVPKKPDAQGNKRWRVVLDYRRLNACLEDDRFPLANITEILDSLSGAVYFTTLDLSQGFYQLEINESDRPCTAFVTDRGQFQMKKLPMGIKTSPSAFSRMMTIAMAGLNYRA
jgi:Reverse transcriptase (RNA-dependent DNA polymerase)